jgi:PhnB protein
MSKALIQPYLFFGGRCEEALEFYRQAIGAEVEMVMRFDESPEPPPPGTVPEGYENKVMHASSRVGESVVMASDGCGEEPGFQGFNLSIAVETEAEADRVFSALAERGEVNMPLSKTFWSPRFGMLTDRFGVNWMVNVVTESS